MLFAALTQLPVPSSLTKMAQSSGEGSGRDAVIAVAEGPSELNLWCRGCNEQHMHFYLKGMGYMCERFNGCWSVLQVLMTYAYDDTVVPWQMNLPEHVKRRA